MTRVALSPQIRRWGLPPYLVLRVIFLLVFLRSALSDHQPYRTAYGCEGATLSISCEPGHVINVIRANYGRFSITICNPEGNTEWSVNCQSPRTHRVLIERCSGKPTCEIGVSSDVFGDPCPGTVKYIELHYTCGIATTTTTTTRPRPPWFAEQRPPIWFPPTLNTSFPSTPSTNSLPPTTTTISSTFVETSSTSSPTTTSIPTTTGSTTTTSASTVKISTILSVDRRKHKDQFNTTTTSHGYLSTSTPIVPSQVPLTRPTDSRSPKRPMPITPPSFRNGNIDVEVPWCAPTFTRGLYWNWTKSGDFAVLTCPGGATGSARRKCQFGEWVGSADLSECRSAWLTNLEARANGNDAVLGVSTDLAKVTSSKALYGGDLITAARLIKTLSRRMMKDAALFPEPHQRQALVTEFLLAALETGSALLSAGMAGPWGDLSVSERRTAVTELMIGLEEASFLLASVLPMATQATHFKSHVLASARAVPADGSSVKFPSNEDSSLDWVFTESVLIPPEAVLENSEGGTTRVIFLTFRHLEDLLIPHDEKLGSYPRRNVSRIVNSRVVSASLGHGRHIQLPEPVMLTFSLLRHDNVSNPVCAFWDYTTYSWSDEGCFTIHQNRTHVTCKCNHLTNFAVIMDESNPVVGDATISPLRILSYIGCFICAICVASSVLMFTLFKSLSSPRTHVQKHVSICILIAEIAFIVGVWRTDLPVLCGVVAGVLHYAVLSAFAWMFVEGIQIYMCVCRSMDDDSLELRWWHYVLAYGGPLIVVCGAAVVDPFSFGTIDHCWLRTDNYFVFSLVVPVLALMTIQVALMSIALIRTCRINPDEALKTKETARLCSARSWLRNTSCLLLLLALTWSLALLLLHQPSMPVAAAFCVLNSLYGILAFVSHCTRDQKVRDWCRSSEQESNAWIPQFLRSVFSTEKQTYSPNNHNHHHTTTCNSSSENSASTARPSSPHHHQALTQVLNNTITTSGLASDSLTATFSTSATSSTSLSSSPSSSLSSFPPQNTLTCPPSPPLVPPHHHHFVLEAAAGPIRVMQVSTSALPPGRFERTCSASQPSPNGPSVVRGRIHNGIERINTGLCIGVPSNRQLASLPSASPAHGQHPLFQHYHHSYAPRHPHLPYVT